MIKKALFSDWFLVCLANDQADACVADPLVSNQFRTPLKSDLHLSVPAILKILIFTDFCFFLASLSIILSNLGVICLSQALLHTYNNCLLVLVGCAEGFAFMLDGISNSLAETLPLVLLFKSFVNCSLMVSWFAVSVLFPLKRGIFAVLSNVHDSLPTLPKCYHTWERLRLQMSSMVPRRTIY